MQPYFRDAVRDDIPAIATILRDRAEREGRDTSTLVTSFRDALSEIDRADGNYVLVGEYDNQIGAVLQFVAFRRLDHGGGRKCEIVLLEVAEPFKTSGIDAMLLDHALARARDLGCSQVQVLSSTARADEHPFWERSGFIHLDRGYVRPLA